MEDRTTDDLQQQLMQTADLNGFLTENKGKLIDADTRQAMNDLFRRKGMTKAALARQAGMSEIYLHQIFAGVRTPSRNRLLCLCLGMSATLDETQEFLKRCGQATLYPRSRRDAVIIYGILHGEDPFEVNDLLLAQGEEPLL